VGLLTPHSSQTILTSRATRTSTRIHSYGTCPSFSIQPSLIASSWKQRDIHEKREQRKHKIAALKVEIESNDVLLQKLNSIAQSLAAASSPAATFSSLVQSLKENPSPDAPPVNHLGQAPSITYDAMILSLLLQISDAAKKSTSATDEATLSPILIAGLNEHIKKLSDIQVSLRRDLEAEEKERAKRITIEDIHDGFDSKVPLPSLSFQSTLISLSVRRSIARPSFNHPHPQH
jgi:hypothetical protein